MAKDQFGFGTDYNFQQDALDWAGTNKESINEWLGMRPHISKTYDDFYGALESGDIGFNPMDRDLYESEQQRVFKDTKFGKGGDIPFAWFGDNTMNFPNTAQGREAMPHELMHWFTGHGQRSDDPNLFGVDQQRNPEMDWYTQKDVDLGGWLPNMHPFGRAPVLPDWVPGSGRWNEKYHEPTSGDQTRSQYSDKYNYHPWYDSRAFEALPPISSANPDDLTYDSGWINEAANNISPPPPNAPPGTAVPQTEMTYPGWETEGDTSLYRFKKPPEPGMKRFEKPEPVGNWEEDEGIGARMLRF